MKHATMMSFEFLHDGDYPESWMENHIKQMLEESLKAYNLQYLGATFESTDHNHPDAAEREQAEIWMVFPDGEYCYGTYDFETPRERCYVNELAMRIREERGCQVSVRKI